MLFFLLDLRIKRFLGLPEFVVISIGYFSLVIIIWSLYSFPSCNLQYTPVVINLNLSKAVKNRLSEK